MDRFCFISPGRRSAAGEACPSSSAAAVTYATLTKRMRSSTPATNTTRGRGCTIGPVRETPSGYPRRRRCVVAYGWRRFLRHHPRGSDGYGLDRLLVLRLVGIRDPAGLRLARFPLLSRRSHVFILIALGCSYRRGRVVPMLVSVADVLDRSGRDPMSGSLGRDSRRDSCGVPVSRSSLEVLIAASLFVLLRCDRDLAANSGCRLPRRSIGS